MKKLMFLILLSDVVFALQNEVVSEAKNFSFLQANGNNMYKITTLIKRINESDGSYYTTRKIYISDSRKQIKNIRTIVGLFPKECAECLGAYDFIESMAQKYHNVKFIIISEHDSPMPIDKKYSFLILREMPPNPSNIARNNTFDAFTEAIEVKEWMDSPEYPLFFTLSHKNENVRGLPDFIDEEYIEIENEFAQYLVKELDIKVE